MKWEADFTEQAEALKIFISRRDAEAQRMDENDRMQTWLSP